MSERRASRSTGAGLPLRGTGAGSPPVLRGDAHRGDETIHRVRALIRSHGVPTVERGWPPPPVAHPPTAARLAAALKESGRLVLAVPGPYVAGHAPRVYEAYEAYETDRGGGVTHQGGPGTGTAGQGAFGAGATGRGAPGTGTAGRGGPDTGATHRGGPDSRVWLTVPACSDPRHEPDCHCDPDLTEAFVRTVLPGWLVAAADTRLRTAVHAYQEHYAPVDDLSAVAALTGTFADTLLADCVVGAATDALRGGTETRMLSAVCGYLVPRLLREGAEELIPLSARRRDGGVATSAYDFSAAREAEALMAAAGPVPGRPAHLLTEFLPGAGGRGLRPLGREFRDFSGLPADRDPVGGAFRDLIRVLNRELRGLERRRTYLSRPPSSGAPDPAALAVADRLALLTAAACGLSRLRRHTAPPAGEDTDRAWLLIALSRVLRRLGHPAPRLPRGQVGLVLKELITRDREGLAYDLSRERIDLEIGSTA
ncbi:hypothetical protein ACGFW5_08745 [Streptomyces sp. NPDC048416]|uniref:hypothetical protein n=1 Tax=Streptomyces sp. NPDC048416 TaxID=3365546 RepID=UPI0037137792